jgi:hypothetical protein
MNYAEARDLSLHLIHQESIAGARIPGTYNNQQDYVDKIPGLINAAQMDLATTTKKIPAVAQLSELPYTENGISRIYTMPTDLWQRNGAGVLVPTRDPIDGSLRYKRFNRCRALGRNQLIFPCVLPGDSLVEYWRYPRRLEISPDDDDQLDNVPEAQEAVPYYVAAHLVLTDDAFLYASLYNTYEEQKQSMQELPVTEIDVIEDVFFGGADMGW